MSPSLIRPEKAHGLVFDGAVFIGNLALVGVVPKLGDDVHPATGGAFLIAAVLAQLTGAWIKKRSLSPRLARQNGPPGDSFLGGLFNLLLLFHFIFFTTITLFSFTLLGITRLDNSEVFFLGWMLGGFLIGGLTTYLVWTAARPPTQPDQISPGPLWLEYAGDALLWISVMIISRVFWDSLLELIQPATGVGFSGQGIALLGAMTLLYLFFYLPARYLFLVEDYRSGWTWIQMLVAMVPVVGVILSG